MWQMFYSRELWFASHKHLLEETFFVDNITAGASQKVQILDNDPQ